jgi:hypothetical protein
MPLYKKPVGKVKKKAGKIKPRGVSTGTKGRSKIKGAFGGASSGRSASAKQKMGLRGFSQTSIVGKRFKQGRSKKK